jgi:hypothetical protein
MLFHFVFLFFAKFAEIIEKIFDLSVIRILKLFGFSNSLRKILDNLSFKI